MRPSRLIVAAAVVLLIVVVIAYAAVQRTPSFVFNNKTYAFTYVATNQQEWSEGLMNKTVGNTTFELFAFPATGVYPFWMKNTYYPLDMIWINGSQVVYIANATPCVSYSPEQNNCTIYNTRYEADYVIEAQSGFVNRTGMEVGDTVSIIG